MGTTIKTFRVDMEQAGEEKSFNGRLDDEGMRLQRLGAREQFANIEEPKTAQTILDDPK